MANLEEQLLIQRLSARVAELESWLSLMVMMYGSPNGQGWKYEISDEAIHTVRQLAGRVHLSVAITLDIETLVHTIDVL